MAEIVRVTLDNNPEALGTFEVDGVVVLVEPKSQQDWSNESLRCLDWTLNHQLRRALEKMGELPVFVPSMNKIKAPYVVLCSAMSGKKSLEQNCQTLALKSLAIISEKGQLPSEWCEWTCQGLTSIYLCEVRDQEQGERN